MKAICASVMLALSPMLLSQAPAEAVKTPPTHAVVVSLNRVAAESADGKAANQKLSQLAQKMAADIQAREKDGTTKPEELQRFRVQSQTEFASTQRQVQSEMRAKLNPIITEIAAKHGADVVLSADAAVVWASPKIDITGEVLARLSEPPK